MLKRQRQSIRYSPIVLVSSEGRVTEPEYLHAFARLVLHDTVTIHFAPWGKGGSSPESVLNRMQHEMNRMSLREKDEAWLVLDRDRWTDAQLQPLLDWVADGSAGIRRGIALSNPKFELWLLLHFEPVTGSVSAHGIDGRIATHFHAYVKHIPAGFPTRIQVDKAIENGLALNGTEFHPLSQCPGTGMVTMAKQLLATGGH